MTAPPGPAGPPTALQGRVGADPAVAGMPALYHRLTGDAAPDGPALRFGPGGKASFDTYFNLLDAGLWRQLCPGGHLEFRLTGQGRLHLAIEALGPDGRARRLHEAETVLTPGQPFRLDARTLGPGLLYPVVTALGPAAVTDFGWHDLSPPRRDPRLCLCITTFRREAAAARAVARFRDAFRHHPLASRLALIVADNGGTLALPPDKGGAPPVVLLKNPNLGGSGGFARGLIEARARGATHCLFMDDDAQVHMDAVVRAWALFARAQDPATALAGAMLDTARPAVLWENGATFRRFCHPLGHRADLTDPAALAHLAAEAAGPSPPGLYGGWWFFGFPLDAARHLPFPFFVRGDDVSFSLSQPFAISRLPGVAAAQENFADKQSPLTAYLDLRSHMAHHLALPSLAQAAPLTLWIAWKLCLRALLRAHYETLAALLLAFEDVLAGPGFFAAQADLAARRADIARLTRIEAWVPCPAPPPAPPPRRLDPDRPLARLAMLATLNGHLLPFFAGLGDRVVFGPADRARIRPYLGVSEALHLSPDGSRCYRTHHDKARASGPLLRLLGLSFRFLLNHHGLRRRWRAGYPRLTSEGFWTEALGLAGAPPPPPLFPAPLPAGAAR